MARQTRRGTRSGSVRSKSTTARSRRQGSRARWGALRTRLNSRRSRIADQAIVEAPLDTREAAVALGVSLRTLYDYVARFGDLIHERRGRKLVFYKEHIQETRRLLRVGKHQAPKSGARRVRQVPSRKDWYARVMHDLKSRKGKSGEGTSDEGGAK